MRAHADDAARLRRVLVSPLDVARKLGLDRGAKRQPGGVMVSCPWHRDGTPSCSITLGSTRTIRAHCFGCGKVSDVLGLIAAVEGLDVRREFRKVLERAAALASVVLDEAPAAFPEAPKAALVPLVDDVRFDAILLPVFNRGQLDGSPIASDVTRYLGKRGLLDEARADGWAALDPAPRGEVVASMLREHFGADARATGLVRDDGRLARPEHRLLIGWRDPAGRLATLQRRRLDAGEPKYVFPLGRPPRWPYGVERLDGTSAGVPVVFVEGAVDVLAARALARHAGRERVVLGLPGVSGWRPEWATLAAGRHAFVALDADAAGDAAVPRIARDLLAAGATGVERLRPVGAKDWGEGLVMHARGAR